MKNGGHSSGILLRSALLTACCSLLTLPACFGGGSGGGSTELSFRIEIREQAAAVKPDTLDVLIFEPSPERLAEQQIVDCNAPPADPLAAKAIFRQSFRFDDRKATAVITAPGGEVDVVIRARAGDEPVFLGGKRATLNAGGVTDVGVVQLQPTINGVTPTWARCEQNDSKACATGRTKSAELKWNALPTATRYWVCAKETAGESFEAACLTGKTTVSLPPGKDECEAGAHSFEWKDDTQYEFKFIALSENEASLYSDVASAMTIRAPGLPDAKIEDSTMVLTFDPVERATDYKVYFDVDGPGPDYNGRIGDKTSPVTPSSLTVGGKIELRLTGVRRGTKYYVAVRAFNRSTNSESSYGDERTVAVPHPAPQNVKVKGRTGRVEISWDPVVITPELPDGVQPGSALAVAYETRYVVFYGTTARKDDESCYDLSCGEKDDPGPLITKETTAVVTGLENEKEYFFAVRVQNNVTQSAFSKEVSATPLPIPQNVASTMGVDLPSDSLALTFTFDKVEKATGYRFFVTATPPTGVGPTGPLAAFPAAAETILGVPLKTETNAAACASKPCKVVITGLAPNVSHKVAMTAVIDTKSESDLSPVKTLLSPPDRPALTVSGSTGRASLQWLAIPGAAQYRAYYDKTTHTADPSLYLGTGATEGKSPVTVTATSASLTNLSNAITGTANTYYLRVSALNSDGTEGRLSDQISATPLSAPTGFGVMSVADSLAAAHLTGQVPLKWDAVPSADCYKVRYGATSGSYSSCLLVKESSTTLCPAETGCSTTVGSNCPSSVAGRCATIGSLTNATTEYFVLTALRSGVDARTETDSTAQLSAVPIDKPASFAAKGRTGRVELSWNAVSGATSGYEIRWNNASLTEDHLAKSTVANGKNVVTTSCTSMTLCAVAGTPGCGVTAAGICPAVQAIPSGATFPADGSTAYFSIVAMNGSGRSNQTNDAATPLAKPVLSAAANAKDIEEARLVFEWTAATCTNVSGCSYKVGYDTASRAGTLKISDYKGTGAAEGSSTVANTSCTNGGINERCALSGLPSNSSYFLSTAAITTAGDESDPMDELNLATLLPMVRNFKVTMGTGKAVMTWDTVTGADNYKVFVDTKGAGSCPPALPTVATTLAATSYTAAGLTDGTRYCLGIVAVKGAAPFSAPATQSCQVKPTPGTNSSTNNCSSAYLPNKEGIPLAPISVTLPTFAAGAVAVNSVTLKWSPPAVTTGIDAYNGYYGTSSPLTLGNCSGTGCLSKTPAQLGCGTTCGNLNCENGETAGSCPGDCAGGADCPDGICEYAESNASCAADCTITTCGNSTCDAPTETNTNCPKDCYGCWLTLPSLTSDQTYYYQVVSANDATSTDTENGESDPNPSPAGSVKTLLPTPANLKVTTTTGKATLTWDAITGSGVTYYVYYLPADAMLPAGAGPPPYAADTKPGACPAVTKDNATPYTTNYNATGYGDACEGASSTVTTTSATRTLTCLENNDSLTGADDSYCFRVQARTLSNYSDFTDQAWGTPPNYPSFSGTAAGTVITILWSGLADPVQGYKIYYDKDQSGAPYAGTDFLEGPSPIVIAGNSPPYSKTLNLPTSAPPTTFYFTMTAINDSYRGTTPTTDSSAGESSTAPEITISSGLAQPQNFKVSSTPGPLAGDVNDGPSVLQLQWDAVTNATSYKVFYDQDVPGPSYDGLDATKCGMGALAAGACDSGPSNTGITVAAGCTPTCTYLFSGFATGITHYFTVKAYNATGESPYATEVQGIPLAQETITLTPIHNSNDSTACDIGGATPTCVKIDWGSVVSGATNYKIHYKDDQNPGTTNPPTGGKIVNAAPSDGCPDPDGGGVMEMVHSGCDSVITIKNIQSSQTSYTLKGIPEGVQLTISVQPEIDATLISGAKITGTGDYSADVSITTPLKAPDILGPYSSDAAKKCAWNTAVKCSVKPLPSASAPTSVNFDFDWPDVAGADAYEVHYTKSTDPRPQPYYSVVSGSSSNQNFSDTAEDTVWILGLRSKKVTDPSCASGGGIAPGNVCGVPVLLTDPPSSDCGCKGNSPTACTQGPPGADGSSTTWLADCRGMIILDNERPTFGGAITVDKTVYTGGAISTPASSHAVTACHTGEGAFAACDPADDIVTFTATLTDYIHTLNSATFNTYLGFTLGDGANPLTNIDNGGPASVTVAGCASGVPADPGAGAATCGAGAAAGNSRTYTIKYKFTTTNTVGQGGSPTTGTISVVARDLRAEVDDTPADGAGNERTSTVNVTVDNRRPQLLTYTVSPANATNGTVVTVQFQTDEALTQNMGTPSGANDGAELAERVTIGGNLSTTCSVGVPNFTYTCTRTIINPIDAAGTAAVRIRGTDSAGNDMADETTKSINIDYNVPGVCTPVAKNFQAFSKNVGANTQIILTVTAANPGANCPLGANGLEVSADFSAIDDLGTACPATVIPLALGAPEVNCAKKCTTAGGGSCTLTWNISAANTMADGTYNIPVAVRNATGTPSPTVNVGLLYDKTLPVPTLTAPTGAGLYVAGTGVPKNVAVSWTKIETNPYQALVEFSDDGGAIYTTYAAIENYSGTNDDGATNWPTATACGGACADGATYRVRVTLKDLAGNIGSPSASSANFTLDNTAPTVAISGGTPGQAAGQVVAGGPTSPDLTVGWTTTDSNPDQAEIRYSTDNTTCASGSFTSTIQAFAAGNDLPAGPKSTTWDTPATDGVCTSWNKFCLKITAKDKAGNQGSAFSANSFTVDNTAPSLTGMAPDGAEVWGNTPAKNVTWTASECNRNTANIMYRTDGGAVCTTPFAGWTAINAAATDDGSEPWTLPAATENSTDRVCIVLTDAANNTGASRVSASNFSIDTVSPSVVVNSPAGTEIWSGNQNIQWSTTDANRDTVDIAWSNNGVVGPFTTFASSVADCAPPCTFSAWDTVNQSAGSGATYRIRVTATDSAGNTGSGTSAANFTVDNAAPTCTVTGFTETNAYAYASGTSFWYNTAGADNFIVNVTASDGGGSGIQKVSFPATVSAGGDDSTSPYNFTYTWDAADSYAGLTTLTAYDNATPSLTGTCTLTITKDTTAPSSGSVSYLNGFTNNPATNNITLSNGTDDIGGSGIGTVQLERQSATMTVGVCGAYGAFGVIFTNPVSPYTDSTVTDGNCYKYRLVVNDNVSNQATFTSTDELKVDTFNPAVPSVGLITVAQNAPGANDTITGAATAVEGSATLKVYKNSACGVGDVIASFTVLADGSFVATSIGDNQADGSNCIYYRAVDAAANQSACSACDTNDVTAPSAPVGGLLTLTQNPPGSNDTLGGAAGAADNGVTVRVYSDTALTALIATTTASPLDGSFLAFSIGDNQGDNGVDPNVVYVVAEDAASNKSAPVTKQNDRTSPTCSVPSITESAAEAFSSGTTVWYNNNTVGGTFTVSVNANDTGGSGLTKVNFPATVNTGGGDDASAPYAMAYTWIITDTYSALSTATVYDNAQNTSTCTFTVTRDTTATSGGSVDYTNGFITSTSTNVTLADGTDNGGGAGLGTRDLQRRSAVLTGTVCGAFGGWGSITTNPSSPYSDTTLVDVNCYEYRYLAPDNVGNPRIYTVAKTIKVDATPPSAPVAINLTLTQNAPGGNDTLTGAPGAAEAGTVVKVYSDSGLTTLIGCTGNNPPACSGTVAGDGSFVPFDIGDNQADTAPEPDQVYVVAVDTAANVSTATTKQNDKTSPTCSISLITEGTNPNYQFVGGTQIYFNTAVGGDFTVTATASDLGGGTIQDVTFPATVSAGGVDAAAPYNQLYTWTVASPNFGLATATAKDTAGNTGTCTFTVTRDVLPSAGGSISFTNGYITVTSTNVNVDDGTDAGSGVATRNLQRRSAVLTTGACGGFGAFGTITNPSSGAQVVPDTVADGNCYEYQYEVLDNVSNTVTSTMVGTLKVDGTAPGAPDAAKLQVNMNATPTQDQAAPTPAACPPGTGAVGEANATLRVFKEAALSTLLGSATLDANGCFNAFNIGDNQAEAATSLVYFTVRDAAGNQSSPVTKTNDITAPTFGSATPDKTSYKDGDTITITVNWGETGLTSAPASITANFTNIDSGGPAADACTGAGPAYTCDWQITAGNTRGDNNYTIAITATDAAGNATTNSSLSLNLDNTPPSIGLVGSDKPYYKDGDTITLTVNTTPDEPSTTTAVAPFNSAVVPNTPVDDQCVAPCNKTGTFSAGVEFTITHPIAAANGVGDSTKTVRVTVTDVAGNSDTFDISFDLDNNAPAAPNGARISVIQNASPTADQVRAQAPDGCSAGFPAVEAGATVEIFAQAVGGVAAGTTTADANGCWAAVNIGNNTGDVADLIYIQQKDQAGNTSPRTSKTNDKTAPSAPDPAKMTLTQNTPGSNDTLVGVANAVEASVTTTVKVYRDSGLTLLNSSTAANADGSFASFSIGDNLANGVVNPNVVYVVAVDAAGNVSGSTTMQNDITIPTCAATSISESLAEAYSSGTTVFYNNNSADGTFTVNIGGGGTTDDGGSSLQKITFPATVSAGGDVLGLPPYSKLYSWEDAAPGPASTYSALATATIYDNANNFGTCTFTVTRDIAQPAGGSVSITDGYFPAASVPVTFTNGTDTSGIAQRLIQRKEATLTTASGACGAYGAFGTVATDPGSSPYSDTSVVTGKCYQFQYVVTDNVGISNTYSSANTAKVDTAAPSFSNATLNPVSGLTYKCEDLNISFCVDGESNTTCLAANPVVNVDGNAMTIVGVCTPAGGACGTGLLYSYKRPMTGSESVGTAKNVTATATDPAGNSSGATTLSSAVEVVYGRDGACPPGENWPKATSPADFVESSPLVADIQNGGNLEIAFGSSSAGAADTNFYLKDSTGADFAGWPVAMTDKAVGIPAGANLDGDADLEFIMGSNATATGVRKFDGTVAAPTWTYTASGPLGKGGAAIADLEVPADGTLDIIIVPLRAASDLKIEALTPAGALKPGWATNPVSLGAGTGGVEVVPALANLNGAGNLEVIVGMQNGLVAIRDGGTGAASAVCTGTLNTGFASAVNTSPVVGNLDADAFTEIAVATAAGRIHVFDTSSCSAGVLNYTVTGSPAISASLALGNLDGDAALEIVVAAENGRLELLDAGGGSIAALGGVTGWPKTGLGVLKSSPLIADVDNDGTQEIVLAQPDGKIYAWEILDGSEVAGWPLISGIGPINSTPTIANLDADNYAELVVGSNDANIHVFEIRLAGSGTASHSWPTFHKNAARTGN